MARRYVRRDWTLAERLAHYMGEVRDNGCREWQGAFTPPFGYGILRWGGRMQPVHRLVWEIENGPIPTGMVICHRCDNPPCCNPDHLFLGTKADNNRDRAAKGRNAQKSGVFNGRAKLTDAQVLAIRADPRSLRATARAYGINYSTVAAIRKFRLWKHVAAENGVTFGKLGT